MEHLPHGDYPKPFKIPFICKNVYDHEGEWSDYPATQGFNLDHLRAHAFYHYPPETVSPFLQSWLYFGLLFAILPFKPEFEDFLMDDGNCVTTYKLPMYFEKWRQHAASLSEKQRLLSWRKNMSILEDAHRTILLIGNWPHKGLPLKANPIPPVNREMCMSFAVLGRALELANNEILSQGPQATLGEWHGGWSSGSLLLEHMENLGWCPFLIAGFEHSFSIDGKYFASTIGAPRVKRTHRTCTDEICMYRSKGIQHVTPMCQCIMFSPEIDKMGGILAGGKLPLLRFVADIDGNGGKLEIVEGEGGMDYIAMSHVWSDGLGNFDANEMPACQLSRIQKAVDSMYHDGLAINSPDIPSMPFWMDTLLIPNDPKLKDIKDATIINMTQIYKNAKAVLVIDSEVATCSLSSDSLGVLLRIVLSNWMRRLWTLQEGAFADSIHFLLSDGTKSLSALLSEESDGIGVGIKAELRSYLTYRFNRGLQEKRSLAASSSQDSSGAGDENRSTTISFLRSIKKRVSTFLCFDHYLERKANPKEPEIHNENSSSMELVLSAQRQVQLSWVLESAVVRAIRSAADRVSTFASDEALCMALLLDVNAGLIIAAKNRVTTWEQLEKAHPEYFLSPQAKHEKRKLENQPMLLLLESLDGLIPPGIILLPGPRQDTYGFRWAPKSFLNGPANTQEITSFPNSIPRDYPSKEYIDRLPSSLCLHEGGGGLRVLFPGLRLGKVKENCYLEKMFVIDTQPSIPLNIKEENIEGKPPRIWKVLYRDDPDDPPWSAVQPSWQNSMNIGIIIFSYTQIWPNNALTGLMVRIQGEVVEEDEVKSIHSERICRVIISGAAEYDNLYWMKGPEERVSGSWLSMTQRWCVD